LPLTPAQVAAFLGPVGEPGRTPIDKGHPCSCPSGPWCSGPTGPEWLSCSSACRHCAPPKRRRRPVIGPNPSSDAGAAHGD
jgi:hypothetical protein